MPSRPRQTPGSRRLATLVVTVAALASFMPATPAAAEVRETLSIETTIDGVTLNVVVRRPDGEAKVPIVLTYTPYASISPDPVGDSIGDRYLPEGYARVVADTPGTNGSTGCWDYGGPIEQQAGVDLVAALAKLPWSNGKVALIGVSYEGTTANMLGARGAIPGLAAIVPEAAISRWYGYAYQDGVRYLGNTQVASDEGADTPLAFDFGFGRTVGPDPTRPQYPQSVIDRLKPCDAVEHTMEGYSRDPDYGDFWKERDYLKDAASFRVPVLVAHGWQDYNVKQSEGLDFYERLPVDNPRTPGVEGVPFKRLFMFQDSHASPPDDLFLPLLDRFFAQTLKGIPMGVERDLPVISYSRTDEETKLDPDAFAAWPPPTTGEVVLRLGRDEAGGVLADRVAGETSSTLTDTSTSSEEAAAENLTAEAGFLTYSTAPLTAPLRIAGSPLVRMLTAVSSARAQLSPTLFDVAKDGTPTPISRGHMDLRYRDTLEKRTAIPAGKDIRASVRLAPQDWTVQAGHRIVLVLAGSNVAWAVPDDPGASFDVRYAVGESPVTSGSTLALPVVGVAPPALPVVPKASPRLTAILKALRGGRVSLNGKAPRGSKLTITLQRGSRTIATKKLTTARNGRYRVTLRARGKVRALVSTKVGGRRLSARSKFVTAR